MLISFNLDILLKFHLFIEIKYEIFKEVCIFKKSCYLKTQKRPFNLFCYLKGEQRLPVYEKKLT